MHTWTYNRITETECAPPYLTWQHTLGSIGRQRERAADHDADGCENKKGHRNYYRLVMLFWHCHSENRNAKSRDLEKVTDVTHIPLIKKPVFSGDGVKIKKAYFTPLPFYSNPPKKANTQAKNASGCKATRASRSHGLYKKREQPLISIWIWFLGLLQ